MSDGASEYSRSARERQPASRDEAGIVSARSTVLSYYPIPAQSLPNPVCHRDPRVGSCVSPSHFFSWVLHAHESSWLETVQLCAVVVVFVLNVTENVCAVTDDVEKNSSGAV